MQRISKWRFTVAIIFFLTIFIHIPTTRESSYNNNESFSCAQLCPYQRKLNRTHLEFDSAHIIENYPEFVCQGNFRNLADWVYGWPKQINETFEVTTTNGKHIAPCLPHGSIIYVSIWSIGTFFADVYPHLINDFVLITGEGDLSSPNLSYLERADSKIIHWFGQNGATDASGNKKFTHIPIGIQCYEMAEALRAVHHTVPSVYGNIDEPSHYTQPIYNARRALMKKNDLPAKNLLLINFNINSDGKKLRRKLWLDMCQKNKQPSFATCFTKPIGVNTLNLASIYFRNRQYAFWLSPRGNGIDCHRTWEALYLDMIPIVWNSSLSNLYEDLPIVIIQNHKEITEAFLRQKLHEISQKKLGETNGVYRMEKLRHSYWRRLILSKSRHSPTDDIIRTNQCWRARF